MFIYFTSLKSNFKKITKNNYDFSCADYEKSRANYFGKVFKEFEAMREMGETQQFL